MIHNRKRPICTLDESISDASSTDNSVNCIKEDKLMPTASSPIVDIVVDQLDTSFPYKNYIPGRNENDARFQEFKVDFKTNHDQPETPDQWRSRLWPAKALTSYCRVMTRCQPPSINISESSLPKIMSNRYYLR